MLFWDSLKRLPILIIASMVLTSCMVGPDFESPPPPDTNKFTRTPIKKTIRVRGIGQAGKAQYFEEGKDIPAKWWQLYHSPEINDLVEKGLRNSPTLDAAQANLLQLQELLYAQVGSSMFPNVGLVVDGMRQQFLPNTFGIQSGPGGAPRIFSLYDVNFPITYTLDLFGGLRRAIEVVGAQLDIAQFQLEAAYLTLTSNIVTTSVTVASLRAQIEATNEIIHFQQGQLDIMQKQYRLGAISQTTVLTQQAQVALARATLPALQQSLAQNLHALAVLIGEMPSEAHLPKLDLYHLTLPVKIPITLPARLICQRPDIQAAVAAVHVASAQVGVATANKYPQINLTALYGWQNESIANMFQDNNEVWNYMLQLTQPIFNAGALSARQRAAQAALQQAIAQYRQTVLQGFQNVADSLNALKNDARTLREQVQAESSTYKALDLTQQQYALGGANYLSLLIAQLQYQQAKIGRVQAQAARFRDTAALFQALGGGWWNREKCICRAKS